MLILPPRCVPLTPTPPGRLRLHVRVLSGRQHRLRAGHQADRRDGDGDGGPGGRRALQVVHGALRAGLPGSQVSYGPLWASPDSPIVAPNGSVQG